MPLHDARVRSADRDELPAVPGERKVVHNRMRSVRVAVSLKINGG